MRLKGVIDGVFVDFDNFIGFGLVESFQVGKETSDGRRNLFLDNVLHLLFSHFVVLQLLFHLFIDRHLQ